MFTSEQNSNLGGNDILCNREEPKGNLIRYKQQIYLPKKYKQITYKVTANETGIFTDTPNWSVTLDGAEKNIIHKVTSSEPYEEGSIETNNQYFYISYFWNKNNVHISGSCIVTGIV